MNMSKRHAIVVAMFFAVTGCGGGTEQSSLAPAVRFPISPMAVDRARQAHYPTGESLLFESTWGPLHNFKGSVNIYQTKDLTKNPAPIATITSPPRGCPEGLAMDKAKTLYVVDCLGKIELYPKGSTMMKSEITNGLGFPLGIAIDKNQTLYVSDGDYARIQEYAKGSKSPTKTISGGGMVSPWGVSLDAGGNLYVADPDAVAVFELPAGGSSVTNLNLQDLHNPEDTAVDQKTGLLWVTDGQGDKIYLYQLGGSTSPVRSIQGNGFPFWMSIQNQGKPRGTVVYGDSFDFTIYAFHAGQYSPYARLTNDVGNQTGLLITQP